MNTYDVTFDLRGSVTIRDVLAHDEGEAARLAEEEWTGDCEDLDITKEHVTCTGRPISLNDLADDPEAQEVLEVARTTIRQFDALRKLGITRTLYAVPLEGEDDAETATNIITHELNARVKHFGNRTYLEASR